MITYPIPIFKKAIIDKEYITTRIPEQEYISIIAIMTTQDAVYHKTISTSKKLFNI